MGEGPFRIVGCGAGPGRGRRTAAPASRATLERTLRKVTHHDRTTRRPGGCHRRRGPNAWRHDRQRTGHRDHVRSRGARLALVDRDRARAEETAADIDGETVVVATDISADDGPDIVVAAALDAFGSIDILHNNVGVGMGDGPPHRLADDAYDRIMDINLRSLWRMCRAATPALRAVRPRGDRQRVVARCDRIGDQPDRVQDLEGRG